MKAVVLLSGGVDSSTCLALAVKEYGCENITALNILYGQKHAKELESAKKIAEHYHVDYKLLDLSKIFSFSNCSLLTHSTENIIHESYSEQLEKMGGEGTAVFANEAIEAYILSTA